jgi:hypothetical protein
MPHCGHCLELFAAATCDVAGFRLAADPSLTGQVRPRVNWSRRLFEVSRYLGGESNAGT